MIKVLITGGLGYVGSNIAVELSRNHSYEIIIVDNLENSDISVLESLGKCVKNLHFFNVDLRNFRAIEEVFAHHAVDTVIHLAAYKSVEESIKMPLEYYQNNVGGLLNILDCCRLHSVSNFIFSSSCTVYGEVDGDKTITETHLFGEAQNPYARSKQIGENILKDIRFMNVVSLRYFNPVGAGSKSSSLFGEIMGDKTTTLFPNLCKAIISKEPVSIYGNDYETLDGTCVRDFIHVEDVAVAHLKSLQWLNEREETVNDVFNIGSSKGYSILEVIEEFNNQLALGITYRFDARRKGDIASILASFAKAELHLGWAPKNNLEKMVKSTLNWYAIV